MRRVFVAAMIFAGTSAHAEELKHAQAMLIPLGESSVGGMVRFSEIPGGGVEVTGQVVGLGKNSSHGFHIHEYGNCATSDGSSAGGHFKVGESHHGGPASAKRHAGDLGNVKSDVTGTGVIKTKDKILSLTGAGSIIGRSVVVHAGEDDLKTDPSGNSGARIACGVIGIVK